MHKSLLACCLLLGAAAPAAHAQMRKGLLFGPKPRPGTYVLNSDRLARRTGRLQVYAHQLVVHDEQGHTTKYTPDDVYRAQVGPVRYVSIPGFKNTSGLWTLRRSTKLFVEVVDSGQVSLYRYRYTTGGVSETTTELETYLLRAAATDSVVIVSGSAYTGQGRRFREALAPYIASRPDLLVLLNNGVIAVDDLPALLHALNTQSPFMAPPRPPSRPLEDGE
ncbi:MAG: hypothetical protein ACRYFX_23865 [Janthinobacterium lividum]